MDSAFDNCADKVFAAGGDLGSQPVLASYGKDVVIEIYDDDGRQIGVYRATGCWPSEHTPAAVPKGEDREFRELLVLQCGGWERRSGNR